MDLLDFEAQDLYFEQIDVEGVKELLQIAAENYSAGDAELPLLQAFFLAPESLNVLVALNRFYYYQHRLESALLATQKALAVIKGTINFPDNWQDLTLTDIENAPAPLLTKVRMYLFTLKAMGFLYLRMNEFNLSQSLFEKLASLDKEDRIGSKALLELVKATRAGTDEG